MDNWHKVIAAFVVIFTCNGWYSYFRRLLSKEERPRKNNEPLKMEDYFPTKDDKKFPQFQQLGEDLMLHVLSFVAEAPFEKRGVDSFVAPLTHSLPLVSQQFKRLVQQNENLWKAALVRQLKKEPLLWYQGLKTLEGSSSDDDNNNNNTTTEEEPKEEEEGSKDPTKILEKFPDTASYFQLYQTVLNTEIRYKGPIFCMNQRLRLGDPYGLHFFEPRYRLLIRDVMEPFPDAAKQGEPIEIAPGQKPPIFIHGHTYPLQRSSPAVLVQVIRCRIYPGDGRADVFLLPIAYVRMEFMWEDRKSVV